MVNKSEPVSGNTPVVGMAEAALIVGVSKSNFGTHRKKFSGEGQCPVPTAVLASGPVWAGKDVAALNRWAKEFSKTRQVRTPRGEGPKKADAKKVAPAAKKPAAAAKKTSSPAKKAAPAKEAPSKGLFGKKNAA